MPNIISPSSFCYFIPWCRITLVVKVKIFEAGSTVHYDDFLKLESKIPVKAVRKFHTVYFGKAFFDADYLYFHLSFSQKLLEKIELYRSAKEI